MPPSPPARRGAGLRSGPRRHARHRRLPERGDRSGPGRLPLRRAALLRQRGELPESGTGRPRRRAHSPLAAAEHGSSDRDRRHASFRRSRPRLPRSATSRASNRLPARHEQPRARNGRTDRSTGPSPLSRPGAADQPRENRTSLGRRPTVNRTNLLITAVEHALRAPSVHNTQPWRWRIADDTSSCTPTGTGTWSPLIPAVETWSSAAAPRCTTCSSRWRHRAWRFASSGCPTRRTRDTWPRWSCNPTPATPAMQRCSATSPVDAPTVGG